VTSDPQLDWLLREIAAVSVPSTNEVAPPLPVGAEFGAFRLLEVIGIGGMGVVYRAYDERLNREVALKVLPIDVLPDEPHQQALLREARTAAAVAHPNIASVYEAGDVGGRAYFAMELLRGSSLRIRLEAGQASVEERLDWALGIARALASLHERGWLHLDVKPENVMIGLVGEAKLLDFGLARTQASSPPGTRAGTPPYMAPEQHWGLALDARADVFAFGVLLQELLTGDRSPMPKLEALPRNARMWRPLIAKCLEVARERRFASGTELVVAFEAMKARRVVSARSRQVLLVAVAVVLVVLAAISFARRPTPDRRASPFGPSLRLTANRLSRPITAAAISWDGKRLAYVDDDGLLIGDASASSRATRVPFEEHIIFVQALPRSTEWGVLTRSRDGGTTSYWRLDERGGSARRIHRGSFKFASAHPDGRSLVLIETNQLNVRRIADNEVSWSLPIPQGRFVCAAHWSPDGTRLAVGYSESGVNGRVRTVEVWDSARREIVHTIRSARLVQAYSPEVFGWAPDGSLLYALTDAPGTGSGVAIWSQAFDSRGKPLAPAVAIASFERQSLGGLAMSANGQLLTLRQDVQTRIHLASILDSGDLDAPRVLTQDDFDERSTGFASPEALWLMSYREFVPHLAKRGVTSRAQAGAEERTLPFEVRGWAQSWPTPVAGQDAVLYWAAEGQAFQEMPQWKLILASPSGVSVVRTPDEPREPLAAVATPPVTSQVRCASRASTCLLATLRSDTISFWRLPLDGGEPSFLFRLPEKDPFSRAWQVSRDGTRVLRVGRNTVLAEYDLHGGLLRSQPIRNLEYVRSLALAEEQGAVYLAGLADFSEDRIVRVTADGERVLVSHSAISYGDLVISPDERNLSFVEKAFDTDVWLTPLQR
jgi:serine/threonine protein kinase